MTRAAPGQEKNCSGTLLGLGVCAVLALVNWHLLTMPIDISPAAPGGAEGGITLAAIEEAPNAPEAASPGAFPETLQRPLFRSSRRPPDPAKPQVAARPSRAAPRQVARLPEDLELVGIMKESGRAERALIRSAASPTGTWIEVGYVLNGWRLSRIESSSILFETDGQKQTLSLFPKAEK